MHTIYNFKQSSQTVPAEYLLPMQQKSFDEDNK